jgi:hypothetical protein
MGKFWVLFCYILASASETNFHTGWKNNYWTTCGRCSLLWPSFAFLYVANPLSYSFGFHCWGCFLSWGTARWHVTRWWYYRKKRQLHSRPTNQVQFREESQELTSLATWRRRTTTITPQKKWSQNKKCERGWPTHSKADCPHPHAPFVFPTWMKSPTIMSEHLLLPLFRLPQLWGLFSLLGVLCACHGMFNEKWKA